MLDRILAQTREDLERRKRELPLEELMREDRARQRPVRRFKDALTGPAIGVIAEFKRRSPSAGALRDGAEVPEIVGAYAQGGAVALSVLTEGPNFGGSLEDLRLARAACGLPILRKDFILDPYQLHEARAAGADAVLLIVAALSSAELESLNDQALAIGLEVLVEVHDGDELQSALAHGAEIIGINNRDLKDFSVDMERTARLMSRIPESVTVVSESGISTPEQLDRLKAAGVQAVLVGEKLMRAPDPAAALRALTAPGNPAGAF
jgi:indole-3-glycerol phosphate synthase